MNRADMKRAVNAALETIGARGLSGVVAEANSFYGALERLDAFPPQASVADRRAIAANLTRLGLVEVTKQTSHLIIQPSVKGVHRLQRARISELSVRTPKHWDGSWRLVSYDIPARYARQRRLFTSELHRLGFTMIKESTWFHPYPCFDVLSELITYCSLSDYVMVAEISRLDEASLRKLMRAYPTISRSNT